MPCAGGRIQRVLQLVFITMDEIDKDVLQDIGINVIGDGYTDEDGCWYDFDELWEAIWCGVFGFCSCGDTGEQFDRLLEVLRLINNMDKKREERMLTLAKLKERQDLHIYLYILDKKDFTDHGGSVLVSWLTKKGESLLNILEYLEEEYDD